MFLYLFPFLRPLTFKVSSHFRMWTVFFFIFGTPRICYLNSKKVFLKFPKMNEGFRGTRLREVILFLKSFKKCANLFLKYFWERLNFYEIPLKSLYFHFLHYNSRFPKISREQYKHINQQYLFDRLINIIY
jgi:hypothetical protein